MNILVVGLGPAGYTLAHYFLNEGFGVIGIDGLKDRTAPPRRNFPVRENAFRANQGFLYYQNEAERSSARRIRRSFEYGITVRWDKNFLTVIHLNLIRRRQFRVYDGIRFGGPSP